LTRIEKIAQSIGKRLDSKDAARESAIKSSRQIIRSCRGAIAAMQAGKDFSEHLKSARKGNADLKHEMRNYVEIMFTGYVTDAQQELVEAEMVACVLADKEYPSPNDIGVSDEAYILGMGDAIGEMRRLFLDALMHDKLKSADKVIGRMELLYDILMTFNYPDSLVPIKRKQDVARSLIEKCRSEFVLAKQMKSLRKELLR